MSSGQMQEFDFVWGAAISAAQTESHPLAGGKGPSIWDEFCKPSSGIFRKKQKIKDNHHLSDSADFYTHYKQDIDILCKIGFSDFRFSIAWSRVLPDGENVNLAGIAFYRNVVEYCLEKGVTPWVTLYHWDLPLSLEKKGGWALREIIGHFEKFAELCVKSLPEVRNWIILNEPSVFLGAGYLLGIHAPGRRDINGFFAATHHAMLSIGHIYRHIKNINPGLNVGSSFSFTHIEASDSSEKNIKAAEKADLLINRLFFEPVMGMGYPGAELSQLKKLSKFILPGDEVNLKTNLDFIGIQTYTREVFKHNPLNPFLNIRQVPAHERSIELTAMNWEIWPESLYNCIMKVHRYGLNIPLYITENGVAFQDKPVFGRVHDVNRINYYRDHISEVFRARADGADVKGYFAWSLIDNFEWAEGFRPRFGLVYVDYSSKERIMKDSAHWFRNFLNLNKSKQQ